MFVIVPTIAHVNSIKLILKLLRHLPLFLHHFLGGYNLYQLRFIKFITLAVTTCKPPEDGVRTPEHAGAILILILYSLHVKLLV
jgi:hypothetical protein